MNVLLVCPLVPFPMRSGDSLRIYNLARFLSRGRTLDLLCIADANETHGPAVEHLKGFCRNVHLVPRDEDPVWRQLPRTVANFFRNVPFKIKYGWSRASLELVRRLSGTERYDAVICTCIETAPHFAALAPGFAGRTVLDLHNVSFFQYLRIYRQEQKLVGKLRQFMNWFPFIDYEPRMAAGCDATLVVSEIDRLLLSAFQPLDNLHVAPNGVDTTAIGFMPELAAAPDLLYLGSLGYPPNAAAAVIMAKSILPLIRRRVPEARLAIVGRNPTPAVQALRTEPGVTVHADVPVVAPFYAASRLLTVPLTAGGGTRLKILEAMAYGLPVVSTRIGCEGIEAAPGRDIAVADAPEDFAAAVVELLAAPDRCEELRRNARRLVEERYDWNKVLAAFDDVLAATPPAGARGVAP